MRRFTATDNHYQAPTRPSANAKRKTNALALKQRTSYPAKETDSAFTSSKKDKRLMKHSLFMSRVQDAGITKQKRRRPGKKLVTNLESLRDALQHVADDEADKSKTARMKNVREGRGQAKRQEKVVKEERERFGRNMAILASTNAKSDESTGASSRNRWAALRAHIHATIPESASVAG